MRRAWIEPDHEQISLRRQCELLDLARSTLYYEPVPESDTNLLLLRLLDEQYTRTPFYGVRRMTAWLDKQGHRVNEKRVRRLLRLLGVEAIYPKPRLLSQAHPDHRVYPYRLRGVLIVRPNQVWSTDITYIRLRQGFVYLTAVIDWFSRYVLSWELSNTLDGEFCRAALVQALRQGRPEIFNTDQGSQFTSTAFTGILEDAQVTISMDGRGRCLDNVFVERLWRSVKYEEVYLNDYDAVPQARGSLAAYFRFYNEERLHQALDYQTPATVWQASPTTPTGSAPVLTAPATS